LIFCTPSGNFGNLCAGIMAYKMGLPVDKFVAATNVNDIVPAYLESSQFNPKPSVRTLSNAMDVGNPSNFPRIQQLYDNDYEAMKGHIEGRVYDDEATKKVIKEVFQKHDYLLCPHSAIGYAGLTSVLKKNPGKKGVFIATASPAKFKDIVEPVIGTEIEMPERLRQIIDRRKQAVPMSNSYDALRQFLLEHV